MKNLLYIISICLVTSSFSQTVDKIPVYIFTQNYSERINSHLKDYNFISIKLLTKSVIDPNNQGSIDENKIKKYLDETFPDSKQSYYCVIDWEDIDYKNLQNYSAKNIQFIKSENKYIQIIDIIKSYKPNLKLSIYGLPFKAFKTNNLNRKNENFKLKNVLCRLDFIAPSLYFNYSNKQIGAAQNIEFINKNLSLFFTYAYKCDLEVIPFIWYRIHPSNKLNGLNIFDQEEFNWQLNKILDFSYNGRKIKSFIWWEPRNGKQFMTQTQKEDILLRYTKRNKRNLK